MKTLKKMGSHASKSYCVQLTKTESGTYEPRLVICIGDGVIFEPEELKTIYKKEAFNTNPYELMVNFCIGFIDAYTDRNTK